MWPTRVGWAGVDQVARRFVGSGEATQCDDVNIQPLVTAMDHKDVAGRMAHHVVGRAAEVL